MTILEFFLQTSLSFVAVFLYHFLHVTFQGGFLLVAILGSLRIIIDPASASYPALLMIGSLGARLWGNEFASLAVVVLLVTSLVSEAFHPAPQEEDVEQSPNPSEEAQTTQAVDTSSTTVDAETKSEGSTPLKKRTGASKTTPKRAAKSDNDAAERLKEAKETARLENEARAQERSQQLRNRNKK